MIASSPRDALSPACQQIHDTIARDGYNALLNSHCVLLDMICDLVDITTVQQAQLDALTARLERVDNLLDLPAIAVAGQES